MQKKKGKDGGEEGIAGHEDFLLLLLLMAHLVPASLSLSPRCRRYITHDDDDVRTIELQRKRDWGARAFTVDKTQLTNSQDARADSGPRAPACSTGSFKNGDLF